MLWDPSVAWRPLPVAGALGIEEICRFRVAVWRGEGNLRVDAFPDGQWRDPIDNLARHWLIRDPQGRPAAAGRLSVHAELSDVHEHEEYARWGIDLPGPVANPDRTVVARFARGRGLGRLILDVQDEAAREQGARYAVRQASPRMLQLLQQRGWRILGRSAPDDRFPGVAFQTVIKYF
jgi:GNAT superfamily N-acetyltransferase